MIFPSIRRARISWTNKTTIPPFVGFIFPMQERRIVVVSVSGFKRFAGWFSKGEKAYGVLDIRRSDASETMLRRVEIGTSFFTATRLMFLTVEYREFNENTIEIQVPVRADVQGIEYNLQPQTLWLQQSGLLVSNTTPFSGGVSGSKQYEFSDSLFASNVSDVEIQNNLDISVSIIKDMSGYSDDENLPDVVRIRNAIYTLTLHLFESKSAMLKKRDLRIDEGFLTEESRSRFNPDDIEKVVYRRIVSLISKYRRPWKFTYPFKKPEVSNG